MQQSVSLRIFHTLEEDMFPDENGEIDNLTCSNNRESETRQLLLKALRENKIKWHILRLAYKNFKSLIKGLLLYKSKNQQTENGELSLTPDEQKILFDVITQ